MLISRSLCFGCLLLAGCDQPDQQVLAAMLADLELKNQLNTPGRQQDLPVALSLVVSERLRDPFQQAVTPLVEPITSRVHEALESYALETLSLVGVLANAKNKLALVKSNQGLHFLQTGQHIGLHEGLVVDILFDRIEIQEPRAGEKQAPIQSLIMKASK